MPDNNSTLILKEKASMNENNICSLYEIIKDNKIVYEYYDCNHIKLFTMIFNIDEKENIAEQIYIKISHKVFVITSLTDIFYYIYNHILKSYTLKINSNTPDDDNQERGYDWYRLSCISSYLYKISKTNLTIHFNNEYINYSALRNLYPDGLLGLMCDYDKIYIKASK